MASRAEISRTALYQIESGKTELPRAGTLRRIAVALDVPMEELLGSASESKAASSPADRHPGTRVQRAGLGWSPAADGPVRARMAGSIPALGPALADEGRSTGDSLVKPRALSADKPFAREGELISKLHDLLHSHLGDCVTKIVDDLHQVLTQARSAG